MANRKRELLVKREGRRAGIPQSRFNDPKSARAKQVGRGLGITGFGFNSGDVGRKGRGTPSRFGQAREFDRPARGSPRADIQSKPRRRAPQNPTNPHNPKSKDPFMRAGIGLGTNDTKIFGRAGMSMDIKKMRKMF